MKYRDLRLLIGGNSDYTTSFPLFQDLLMFAHLCKPLLKRKISVVKCVFLHTQKYGVCTNILC